jgi:hypothetical protein
MDFRSSRCEPLSATRRATRASNEFQEDSWPPESRLDGPCYAASAARILTINAAGTSDPPNAEFKRRERRALLSNGARTGSNRICGIHLRSSHRIRNHSRPTRRVVLTPYSAVCNALKRPSSTCAQAQSISNLRAAHPSRSLPSVITHSTQVEWISRDSLGDSLPRGCSAWRPPGWNFRE